ncbi:MAG TPA: glycosyltransferase family 2 protein [Caulobacterales bacterium]|jgi:dolichol-phosphate mannosyltransferase|nr:glycosyltransferase family 2 protein [Caulobacterales bacterium]
MLVSVVVPVYNEAEGIAHFHERATAAFSLLPDCDYELVYVDDGSRDKSYEIIRGFADGDPRVKVVKFSRNFGHQIAITAGLDYADGDAVVFIDADLQDPPELVAELIAKMREGYDVVYARRRARKGETQFKLVTAAMFYRMLRAIANIDIPPDVGDFRIISARVADQLRAMREKDRFIRGLVSWVGYRQSFIMYDRDERYAGETKYPLAKMIKFAFDGLTSFSSAPLRIATWMGYFSSAMAFLYLLSVFVQVAMGVTVEGWATIVVAVLFLGGVQLICLGIIGEYLGRVFNEIKPRPVYIVEEIAGGRAAGASAVESKPRLARAP